MKTILNQYHFLCIIEIVKFLLIFTIFISVISAITITAYYILQYTFNIDLIYNKYFEFKTLFNN